MAGDDSDRSTPSPVSADDKMEYVVTTTTLSTTKLDHMTNTASGTYVSASAILGRSVLQEAFVANEEEHSRSDNSDDKDGGGTGIEGLLRSMGVEIRGPNMVTTAVAQAPRQKVTRPTSAVPINLPKKDPKKDAKDTKKDVKDTKKDRDARKDTKK
ncbi:uncharacterized protein PHACADRAFT_248148 [Phanerochaete carnosa HHB-10118-sp]|uniref:Uncharacterized protein n=1 Tax=Phanerochaete carnosa (strain HHB-10118-sp) TaxID=650164 RepID=K5VEN7_PHACS|nr:uncharacterized protein PHACADRAFT_248148 [Phanerochaete carnosa HHB-10118-sp]EKM61491.1 hypothetical protein PHACADRAFT_248148 [Phanerochaete carnosa HHB-10118-sp]